MRCNLPISLLILFLSFVSQVTAAQGLQSGDPDIQVSSRDFRSSDPDIQVSFRGYPAGDREVPRQLTTGSRLSLIFTGDIMGHDTQIASALATGEQGYDYRPCFEYLEPYFSGAGLVIGNLEVTFAGPPYRGYPQFSSPDELADALKDAGFDILVNANNHALDRGIEGLERTIRVLDQRGMLHTGTFASPAARAKNYPLIIEKHGIRIALLNYTYGTNGLKVPPPAIVNRIDTVQIKKDIEKATTARPDFILVTIHWGNEYEPIENRMQDELAGFLFRQGADAVIGSHPHVVQPIRGSGKGDLVAYSTGNFISNQRDRFRNGGIVFELELVKDDKGTRIENPGYLPVWVHKPWTKKGTMFTLVPAAMNSGSVALPGLTGDDLSDMEQFLLDTRETLNGFREVEPYWMDDLKLPRR